MSKNNVGVSVIVPVYNVEKYLAQCLDSLVEQTLEDIEIIVVNDGSQDGSQTIIGSYEEKYPDKVKGYIKANGGLGDARNFGMEKARGKYLAFIDSDDWVERDMMEQMFNAAEKNGCDIVLCDLYGFNNETNEKIVEKAPFDEGKIEPQRLMLDAAKPVVVSACTKLYKREVFDKFRFPGGWYEDMGVIPAIYSYYPNVYHLSKPLYYYRWNREGSIQKQKNDIRTLEILKAQQKSLDTCNKKYLREIAYSIYEHTCRFASQYPHYFNKAAGFVDENRAVFKNNKYVHYAIDSGLLNSLFIEYKIPRKLHYCWFGGGEKSESINRCMESWKRLMPEYEVTEWNETNCDINENEYVKKAYELKKWAYVSDYFRFKVLHEHGGIYMDTDVMVYQPLDELLGNDSFFAFETYLYVHGGILGSVPGLELLKEIMYSYKTSQYDPEKVYTVCHRITDALKEHGLKQNMQYQVLKDGIAIYPPNVLTVNLSDGKCIAEHLYDASWMDGGQGSQRTYRYEVLKHYFTYKYKIVKTTDDDLDLKARMKSLAKKAARKLLPQRVKDYINRGKEYGEATATDILVNEFLNNGNDEKKYSYKVSVIVPVYNTEAYIGKCLDSLISQTLDDIEIVVIDNASSDASKKIIEEYVEKTDGKVKFYPQSRNEGPGRARNIGMKKALGKYISFVDSDDWVQPDMLEKMYNVMAEGDYDMVISDIYGLDDQTGEKIIEREPFWKEGLLNRRDMVLHSTRPVAASVGVKLFSRNILRHLNMPEGWYEDLAAMPVVFSFANSVYYLREPLYIYRWNRKGSIQYQKDDARTLDILKAQKNILENCNPKYINEAGYAVYEHTCRIYSNYPKYHMQTMDFVKAHAKYFVGNEHIEWAIKNEGLIDLINLQA